MGGDLYTRFLVRIRELSETQQWTDNAAIVAWATNVLTVLEAVVGPDDARTQAVRRLIETRTTRPQDVAGEDFLDGVRGVAWGVRLDMEGNYFRDLRAQIREEVEGDFLGQATRLLGEGLKDPAAMLVGAVLEDALRQLCRKHGLPEGDSLEAMNEPLRRAGVYGLPQKQQITAWTAIRNKADHGRFAEYSLEEVRLMHQGVSGFVATYLG